MSDLTQEEEERYSDLAVKHANFLCDFIFKPTFEMAFIHGAKHMKEDMTSTTLDIPSVIAEKLEKMQADLAEKSIFTAQIPLVIPDQDDSVPQERESLVSYLTTRLEIAKATLRKDVEKPVAKEQANILGMTSDEIAECRKQVAGL